MSLGYILGLVVLPGSSSKEGRNGIFVDPLVLLCELEVGLAHPRCHCQNSSFPLFAIARLTLLLDLNLHLNLDPSLVLENFALYFLKFYRV